MRFVFQILFVGWILSASIDAPLLILLDGSHDESFSNEQVAVLDHSLDVNLHNEALHNLVNISIFCCSERLSLT
jgi:hypothetical protein